MIEKNLIQDEKDLNKLCLIIKKQCKLDNLESCDRWMIKLFYAMKIEDLQNRVKVMPDKCKKPISHTQKHILNIASTILEERLKIITKCQNTPTTINTMNDTIDNEVKK